MVYTFAGCSPSPRIFRLSHTYDVHAVGLHPHPSDFLLDLLWTRNACPPHIKLIIHSAQRPGDLGRLRDLASPIAKSANTDSGLFGLQRSQLGILTT